MQDFLKFLQPDIIKHFPEKSIAFGNYDLYTVGVLGHGSCFIHSVVYCINERYRKTNQTERINFVTKIRYDLANLFSLDIYNQLGGGTIAEVGKSDDNWSYPKLKSGIADYNHWIGLEFLEFISNKLDINIQIVWWRNGKLESYKHAGENKIMFGKGRNTIILFWQGNNHFQPVGRKYNNTIYYIFNDDDAMILNL